MQDYQNRSKKEEFEASVKNGVSTFAKAEVFDARYAGCSTYKVDYGKGEENYNKSYYCVS